MSAPARLPDIDIQTFAAIDLRVGRVLSVTPFPEARNPAFKLTVDFGELGQLQTSAQITNYAEVELLGRLVIGAINLGTKRVAGFSSEFLLLGAVDEAGIVHLLHADDGARPGDRIA